MLLEKGQHAQNKRKQLMDIVGRVAEITIEAASVGRKPTLKECAQILKLVIIQYIAILEFGSK